MCGTKNANDRQIPTVKDNPCPKRNTIKYLSLFMRLYLKSFFSKKILVILYILNIVYKKSIKLMATLSTRQIQKLLPKLSPQQIQMIKLLELPAIQLEQRIKQEIEENPVLEENIDTADEKADGGAKINIDDYKRNEEIPSYRLYANNYSKDDKRGTIPLSGGAQLYRASGGAAIVQRALRTRQPS